MSIYGGIVTFCNPFSLFRFLSESSPPAPKWTAADIGDQTGKVVVITGANTGIGFVCAQTLAERGAKVYVCARSEQKGLDAVKKIEDRLTAINSGRQGQAVYLHLDLADLKSVAKAADELTKKESRLDVLMNSGGVMTPPAGSVNGAGLELQFATNVLGHYALTRLLLPTLLRTAKSNPDGTVRVVNVASSSIMAAPRGGIMFDNLANGSQLLLYGQSKLGNIVFANELARRYTDEGIISVALNPGNIETDLWQYQRDQLLSVNTFVHKYPQEMGALTQLYAATSPKVTKADSGAYFAPWARKDKPIRSEVHNPALGTKLWDWCDEQMKAAEIAV